MKLSLCIHEKQSQEDIQGRSQSLTDLCLSEQSHGNSYCADTMIVAGTGGHFPDTQECLDHSSDRDEPDDA